LSHAFAVGRDTEIRADRSAGERWRRFKRRVKTLNPIQPPSREKMKVLKGFRMTARGRAENDRKMKDQ
jgi:hypothetical protein